MILLAIMSTSGQTTAHWPTGNARCPCIDPFSASFDLNLGTHAPSVPSASCAITRADGFCYSATYGALACDDHDWNSSPECSISGAPSWCDDLFCWIDPSSCDRPHHPSSWFPNATIATGPNGNRVPLRYSYETCG
jgi:hypothetical protein